MRSIAMFFDDDRSMVYATFSQGFEPGEFQLFDLEGRTPLWPVSCQEEATQVRNRLQGEVAG